MRIKGMNPDRLSVVMETPGRELKLGWRIIPVFFVGPPTSCLERPAEIDVLPEPAGLPSMDSYQL
jgi:hypothetical protein